MKIRRVVLMVATAVVTVAASGPMWAQAAASAAPNAPVVAKEFEVATIRPSDPNKQGGFLNLDGKTFSTQGQSLKAILKFAYALNMSGDQQIVGAPKWVSEQQWDIEAKEDAQSAAVIPNMKSDDRLAAVRTMVQALLVERFHLKFHRETRELPVYALVVAKGGAKLTPTKITAGPDGKPSGWSGVRGNGKGNMQFQNVAPSMIANVIGSQPEIGGKTVIDRTGLTGKYDFELKWTPDMSVANEDDRGASLFTAMQEELGLRLESTKASVEVIVIDEVQEPTAN